MRQIILIFGVVFILSGVFGFVEWLITIIPGVSDVTKDAILSMIGLTWIAIYLVTD